MTPSEHDAPTPLQNTAPQAPAPTAAPANAPAPLRPRPAAPAVSAPRPDNLLRTLVGAAALGIWALVFQNVTDRSATRAVEVVNAVDVRGSVDVVGTTDINISQINGLSDVFYNYPNRDPSGKYFRLPVATP